MSVARSHSLAELVTSTGFDRRTIVYYIQSGLLPKVGRRGPHTRYPDECLTRLLFIKGVRARQSEGELLTATLAEIRRALDARDVAGIRDLLDRGLPVEELTALFAESATPPPPAPAAAPEPAPAPQPAPSPSPSPSPSPGPTGERRSYGLADAGIRRRFSPDAPSAPIQASQPEPARPEPPAPVVHAAPPEGPDAPFAESDLGELLRELEVRPTLNARRNAPGAPEQWTEIPITSRVYLSVRGLATEDAPLAEAVGRLLKRALRARVPSAAS